MWNLYILVIDIEIIRPYMNHVEGYESKKFDNGKRMFTKMQLLPSVAYKNGEICIHVSSETERFEGIHTRIFFNQSIFSKFFSLSFIQDGIRRCNRSRT